MIIITVLRNIAASTGVCGRTEDQDKWQELHRPDGINKTPADYTG